MSSKRKVLYKLYPGYIHSANDRDVHYISYATLIKCYRLDPAICIDGSATSFMSRGYNEVELGLMISLRPRFNGDYAEHLMFMQAEMEEYKRCLEAARVQ